MARLLQAVKMTVVTHKTTCYSQCMQKNISEIKASQNLSGWICSYEYLSRSHLACVHLMSSVFDRPHPSHLCSPVPKNLTNYQCRPTESALQIFTRALWRGPDPHRRHPDG